MIPSFPHCLLSPVCYQGTRSIWHGPFQNDFRNPGSQCLVICDVVCCRRCDVCDGFQKTKRSVIVSALLLLCNYLWRNVMFCVASPLFFWRFLIVVICCVADAFIDLIVDNRSNFKFFSASCIPFTSPSTVTCCPRGRARVIVVHSLRACRKPRNETHLCGTCNYASS